jgi:hypothetical protein
MTNLRSTIYRYSTSALLNCYLHFGYVQFFPMESRLNTVKYLTLFIKILNKFITK